MYCLFTFIPFYSKIFFYIEQPKMKNIEKDNKIAFKRDRNRDRKKKTKQKNYW